ncbi:MAG TPA: AMP-binding protein [Jatrophihabitans sp.]|jgi:acyl-CoA synthetase (AMP-forming)/AMP-acid ligase II|uniref:AMP-binding protein n=1 Tax=Jatrophihabitans sp. TaxID=1932789 RepID=UPI002F10C77E
MLLDWLDNPSPTCGIRLLKPDGSWFFRSYAELAVDVRRISAKLRQAGGARGDVISLVVHDPWTYIASFMGSLAAGMVPSPLATPLAFRQSERYIAHLATIFSVARPALVVTDARLVDLARSGVVRADCQATVLELDLAVADEADADSALGARAELVDTDLALLQFTSGSTGAPKGVRISCANLSANVQAIRSWLKWSAEDVFASWLPLYHDMGLIGGMVVPVVSGTDLWLMTPDQFVRAPLRWLECFGKHGATLTTAPSFGYAYTARRVSPEQIADFDFSRWRVAILGAERIEPAAISAFYQLVSSHGFNPGALIGAYGLAEVTLAATGAPPGGGSRLVRTKSTALAVGEAVVVAETGMLGLDSAGGAGWLTGCGAAVEGLDVSIIDEDGNPLPDGAFGEVFLTGSSLAQGYLTGDGVTPFGHEGLRSGDAGFLLGDELFVVGRIGESMKVRGASVHAEDVESELGNLDGLPNVRCAVAFGAVDSENLAVVFVEEQVGQDWLTAASERVRTITAGSASPLILRGKRGSIARTSSGKPRRRTMWTELLTGAATPWEAVHGQAPVSFGIADATAPTG